LIIGMSEVAAQRRQGGGGARELQDAGERGGVVGRGLGAQRGRGGRWGGVLVQAAAQTLLLAGDVE